MPSKKGVILLYRNQKGGVKFPRGAEFKLEKIIHSSGWQLDDLCVHVDSN